MLATLQFILPNSLSGQTVKLTLTIICEFIKGVQSCEHKRWVQLVCVCVWALYFPQYFEANVNVFTIETNPKSYFSPHPN